MSFVQSFKNLKLFSLVLFFAAPLFADHSKDWLKIEGPVGAEHHELVVFSNQDYIHGSGSGHHGGHGGHDDDINKVSWAPGAVYGFLEWFAFEVHGDLEWEEGGEFNGNSIGFQPRFWWPLNKDWTIGITGEYGAAIKSDLHDHVSGTAILGWQKNNYKAVLNLGAEGETEGDEDPSFVYRTGVKKDVSNRSAYGLEFKGESGDEADPMELIAGYYFKTHNGFGLKVGPGFGLNSDSPDFTFNTAILWSFGGHQH